MARRIFLPSVNDIYHGGIPDAPIYVDIHRERIRAHVKHDNNGDSMERKSYRDEAWLSVVGEEFGEVCRELCETRHRGYLIVPRLRKELVQLAAMTCAWIDAIDLEGPE